MYIHATRLYIYLATRSSCPNRRKTTILPVNRQSTSSKEKKKKESRTRYPRQARAPAARKLHAAAWISWSHMMCTLEWIRTSREKKERRRGRWRSADIILKDALCARRLNCGSRVFIRGRGTSFNYCLGKATPAARRALGNKSAL